MADNPNHIKTTLRQKTNDGIDSTKEIYPKTTIDQLYNEAGTTHFNDESFSKPFVAGTGIDFTAVPDSLVGAKSISVDLTDLKATILDMLYPVGSIYMSASTGTGGLCPIQVGLGGEWIRVEDVFLLAAGSTYPINTEGGSADAVLLEHNHNLDVHGNEQTISGGSHSHTTYVSSHTHRSNFGGDDTTYITNMRGTDAALNLTSSSDTHSHTFTPDISANISPAGVGESGVGKNMPPYKTVYVWKRTE